jgi:hypothetical protein
MLAALISDTWDIALAVAVALGVAWPVFRSKSTSATIELLHTELGIEREAREAQERRCADELAAERAARQQQERRHAEELGAIRGKLDTITREFAVVIADEVVDALRGQGVIS